MKEQHTNEQLKRALAKLLRSISNISRTITKMKRKEEWEVAK
jgi:hypothetical protein